MYENFTKATLQTAEALNICAKFLNENSNTREDIQPHSPQQQPTCNFEVRMVPIDGKVPDGTKVIDIFLAATENIKLNVTSSEEKNGTGYIRVTTMDHANNAVKAINNFVHNGNKCSTMFSVTANAISNNTIRTVKAKIDALANISWIRSDSSIDIAAARNIMMMKNCDWCVTANDIEHIQLNHLPGAHAVIQLFLSSAAFDRIVVKGRNSLRINVGQGITMLSYINVNPVTCYRCLSFGHVMSTCKKEPRCKNCGEAHPSATCLQARTPTCFRCAAVNTRRSHDDQIAEDHHALHRDCPEVAHQGDLALIARQQAALSRFNARSN